MVGGFRVERRLGAGSTGVVYEATQLSLGRTVALRLVEATYFNDPAELERFDERLRRIASLHHPNLVAFYEAGKWGSGGRFVAMRFMRGKTLAELRDDAPPFNAASLSPIADAVAAIHGAGLAHGAISERNIFIEADGSAYLGDPGLTGAATAEGDFQALEELLSHLPEQAALARTRRSIRPLRLALAVIGGVGVVVLALVLASGDQQKAGLGPPSAPSGTEPLGSGLESAGVEPLGCSGDPTPNTPECTIAQTTLAGEPAVVQRRGAIRAWAVRGASGELALQVIRDGDRKAFVAGFSQPQQINDGDPVSFPAEIAVRPGDQIGLRLGSGSAVGARSGAAGSVISRWNGGLTGTPARRADATTSGIELMLRVDMERGARVEGPPQLVGEEAASAPAGRALAAGEIPLSGGRSGRVAVVQLPGLIVIDVFRGRRLARLEVPDADPQGGLLELTQNCGPGGIYGFCLRWLNPGIELPLEHEYRVRGRGRIHLIG